MKWKITQIKKCETHNQCKFIFSFIVTNDENTISSEECIDSNLDLNVSNEEYYISELKSAIGNQKIEFYENKVLEFQKENQTIVNLPWE